MITRLILLLITCTTLLAQRTPLKINGAVVNNPNFTNSASVTYSVNGADVSATATGTWEDIRSYGAVSGDATEDADDIQQAIDAAATEGGGTVFFPAGNWTMSTGVTNGSNIRFLFAPGAVIDASGIASLTKLFRATGSEATGVSLTADATKGAMSVSVSAGAESAFAAGDWVKIGSTNYFTPNTTANGQLDQRIGEIAQVTSTSSGSITLKTPLQDSYPTAGLAFIAKLTMIENVSYQGPVKITGPGTGTTAVCFELDRCLQVLIEGVRMDSFDDASIRLRDVVDGKVSGITVYGGTSVATTFYGVMFSGACQDSTFEASYVESTRHAVTSGGSTTRSGVGRRLSFVNLKVVNTTSTGIDTHAGSDHVSVIGCTVVNAGSDGINIRNPGAIVSGNTISGSGQYGIHLHNQSDRATKYIVANNQIEGSSEHGIFYGEPGVGDLVGTTAGQDIEGVVIEGNAIVNPVSGIGIMVQSSDTFALKNITIANNSIRSPSSVAGIYIDNSTGWTVAGNTITDLCSSCDGIRIEDSNYGSISGGMVEWGSAPASEYGVLGVNADDVVIASLTVRRGARGVSLDNNCSNIVIDRLSTQSCTSDNTLGSGSGISLNRPPDVQVFTTTGANTWTKLAGAKSVSVSLMSGGGGGGSGRKGAAASVRCGGGGGGAGSWATAQLDASLLSSSETVTVGAGGTGGPAQTANDTDGTAGTSGGSTSFGTYLASRSAGGGGAGTASSGTGGTASSGNNSGPAGGTASAIGAAGVNGSTGVGSAAGSGGSGGGITAANTVGSGGNGGAGSQTKPTQPTAGSGGTAGGSVDGTNGTANNANVAMGGAGGGGGAASATGNAGNGGNGGIYGGGGGGGGAALNDTGNSGAGGNGANGIAVVITYF